MWVVRKMYWRSGQQYVQAQKIFESREEANAFRKELDFATEIYETNLAVSNKRRFLSKEAEHTCFFVLGKIKW